MEVLQSCKLKVEGSGSTPRFQVEGILNRMLRATNRLLSFRRHQYKARHQYCVRMACNTPSPGHPSTADDAWH